MNNNIYDNLKIFRTKKFKTKKEEENYWAKIQEENIFEYRQSLICYFNDYFHVIWSRQYIAKILSFVTIILSILFFKYQIYSLSLFSISLILISFYKIYQILLNKKLKEQNFVMTILNNHIDNNCGLK